jgi:hypothetical protein
MVIEAGTLALVLVEGGVCGPRDGCRAGDRQASRKLGVGGPWQGIGVGIGNPSAIDAPSIRAKGLRTEDATCTNETDDPDAHGLLIHSWHADPAVMAHSTVSGPIRSNLAVPSPDAACVPAWARVPGTPSQCGDAADPPGGLQSGRDLGRPIVRSRFANPSPGALRRLQRGTSAASRRSS